MLSKKRYLCWAATQWFSGSVREMKHKVIFLDVDGVLVDSERVFNVCWRKAAESEGYSMTYEQALQLRSLDAGLAKDLFRRWYGNDNAYPAIRTARKLIMSENVAKEPLFAKPGVLEFLGKAKNLPVKVAIVTSSPISRITTYLASVGIDISLFDSAITTEQVKRGKPFPDVYLHACETTGFKPDECIAVEDSPNGVKSAHDAGCYTVMVPDLTPCDETIKAFVDKECEAIMDILNSSLPA